MADIIRDGTGKGYQAQVDKYNNLGTRAVVIPHAAHHSDEDHSAFIVGLHHIQQVAGAQENFGYVYFNGDYHSSISQIRFTTEEPSGGISKLGVWANPTCSGGSGVTPVNMYLGTGITSDMICYHTNDGASGVTLTGGSSFGRIVTEGPNTFVLDYSEALLIPKGSYLALKVSCDTAGTTVRVSIMYFEHTY